MNRHREALSRTTLLINRELFDGAAEPARIADALLDCGVRIRAGKEALRCRAGQATMLTAYSLIARLGLAIELDVPEVPVIDRAAPLRRLGLRESLLDLGADLVPGMQLSGKGVAPQASFVLGASARSETEVTVSVDDFSFAIERGSICSGCDGDQPLGGLAAGAAMAAIALEAALPVIESACGLSARSPRPSAGPPVRLDLREFFPALAIPHGPRLGDVDVISGGAITNALVFCLLRIPRLQASLRVIEADLADLSNINRYALLRRSQVGLAKTELLAACAFGGLQIRGVKALFTPTSRGALLPLAPRVLIGADDVRARWWVQETEPRWLAIGATGDHLAQLTSHLPGTPCAGCLHPVALAPQEIPTISFVSFWAGLLQACALLCTPDAALNLTVFPFALGGPLPSVSTTPVTSLRCPLGCGDPIAHDCGSPSRGILESQYQ